MSLGFTSIAKDALKRWVGQSPFALIVFFLLLCGAIYWQIHRFDRQGQNPNMDRVFYLGCALEFEVGNLETVHARVYKAIEKEYNKRDQKELTEKNWKRKLYKKDAEAYGQQLRFYRERILYNGLLYTLYKAGVPLTDTPTVVSFGTYFLIILLVLVWAVRNLSLSWGVGFAALFTMFPSVYNIARFGTPDILVAFFIVLALFAFVELEKNIVAYALLFIAIFIRPDTAIFLVLLTLAHGFIAEPRLRLKPIFVGWICVVAIGVFFAIKHLSDGHSWWILVQYTMVNTTPHLDKLSTQFDLDQYLKILGNALRAGGSIFTWSHLCLAFVALWLTKQMEKWPQFSRAGLVLVAMVLCMVARYILFPRMWDRLHLPCIIGIELVFIHQLSKAIKAYRPR